MDYLKKLYDDCNEVVREIAARGDGKGPVNWASLRCVSAEHVVEYWGDPVTAEGYRVVIEEASPDATEIQGEIGLALIERGHVGVNVATEW